MPRGPSIRSVAGLAGVSVATVSNVLNGKASVAPHIAARVRSAVDELGYVRDSWASRLRSGVSRLIGLIVPDLANPMFAAFVSELEHLARVDGYDLVVVSSRNDPVEEAERLRRIREWRPAGLILLPCDGDVVARLGRASDMPIVVADRIPDDPGLDLVAVDNAASSGALIRHLAQNGIRECLVVGSSLAISTIRERWEGASTAAEGIRTEFFGVGFEDYAPPALADRLRAAPPEAVLCLEHETALEVYMLLRSLGLRVGIDVAFASFDEKEWMRLVHPAVTAVRQPVEEMAECAWSVLRRRIAGDTSAPGIRRLHCALTLRESSRRVPRLPAADAPSRARGLR